ncbi:MAG: hypothetical protein Kow0059_16690 [Candidatus Sumerlaeia bacterium]
MCAEAPALGNLEALDLAHPFPLYRANLWGRLPADASFVPRGAVLERLLAYRKAAQWRAAPERLVVFLGLRGSMLFLRRAVRRLPVAVVLQDNELESLQAAGGGGGRLVRALARSRLIMGFHPDVERLADRPGLGAVPIRRLPVFIDLALFKPHVMTEGVKRYFRLKDRGAVFIWLPRGRNEAAGPLIKAWVQAGEALQSRAVIVAGCEDPADAAALPALAARWLGGAAHMPPWLRLAGEVPHTHLPYYFNAAALYVHVPPPLEQRTLAGWDIAAAAACGCPTAAPPEGLHTQFITSETGWRADFSSPDRVCGFFASHRDILAPRPAALGPEHKARRAWALAHCSSEAFKAALGAALRTVAPSLAEEK